MPTNHALILDADRHELKGASSATSGTVPFSNGDGTTTFRAIISSDLPAVVPKGLIKVFGSTNTSTAQTPSASDTTMQVKYGSPSANSYFSVDANGNFTVVKAGQYGIRSYLNFYGGASGALCYWSVFLNGVQVTSSKAVNIPATSVIAVDDIHFLDLAVSDVITFKIISDSAGASVGNLAQYTPIGSGWSQSPTAEMTAYAVRGL